MTDTNKHIEEFLDYYLGTETSPDYAVLISGCWGSGKTHFIKQYLGGDVKKFNDWFTGCEKYCVVYVSLFGAKSREDMDKRVLTFFSSKFGSKIIKKIPDAVSLVSNVASVLSIASGHPLIIPAIKVSVKAVQTVIKKIPKKSLKEKKLVVVFDDVERADMPVPELLGYLNQYVEHLHIPCILLADKERWEEAKICQEDKSTLQSLSSTQEKVIGKTFQIQTSFDDVWNAWINDKKTFPIGDKTWKILEANQNVIKQIVANSGKDNYRSLKHTLSDFNRFIKLIDDQYLENDEFNKLLIADFICFQYAYHIGKITAKDIGISNIFDRVYALANAKTDEEKEKINKEHPKTKFENFNDAFTTIEKISTLSDSDYASKWIDIWKNWLLKSTIDSNELNKLINESIWFVQKNEYYLKKMLDWFILDDKTGAKALEAFDLAIENKTLKSPSLIMNLFYKMYWHAKKNTFDFSADDFYERMSNYVKSIKNVLLDENMTNWKSAHKDMLGGSYTENEDINDKFLTLLIDLLNEKTIIRKNKMNEDFLTKLSSGNDYDYKQVCDIILNSQEEEAFSFSEIDVNEFCLAYQKIKPYWRSECFENIKKRYRYNPELLKQEKTFLSNLLSAAEIIYNNAKRPLQPSIFSLYYLIRTLKELLNIEEEP